MNGQLEGAWEYIWSAYAVAWTLLAGYGVYLFTRPHGDVPEETEEHR